MRFLTGILHKWSFHTNCEGKLQLLDLYKTKKITKENSSLGHAFSYPKPNDLGLVIMTADDRISVMLFLKSALCIYL